MKKAFVLAGYQHFAACYLLYHVGRLLEEHFGYEPVMVRLGDERPDTSPFTYPRIYPSIELRELAGAVRPDDLFLPLAAAADLCFGLTLPCRKLLYVQGMNTFKVLDGFMDGYVAVSGFVRRFLADTYGIDAPVIQPFIRVDALPPPVDWNDREPDAVVIYAKAPPPVEPLVQTFVNRLAARHPDLRARFNVIQRGVPHAELMALLARTRHVIALSPVEGFGLLPLEAMACGCAVVGFHGGGGLDYMTPANSRCVGYPRLDELVDHFAAVYREPALGASLGAQGRVDGRRFTPARFDAAFVDYLRAFGA